MKIPLRTLVCVAAGAVLWGAVALEAAPAEFVHFEADKSGEPPHGWLATQTGAGHPKWTVVSDGTAPSPAHVLQQSGEAAYPLAIKNGSNLKNGFVEVKFKLVAGKEDQAGGVVWRARDADNYYLARANALENNVRIYHFVKGKRTQFKGANLPVADNQWHTLRVNFTGPRFTVVFDGREVFTVSDSTWKDAGNVGLWTKADSVTLFDDFRYGTE